MEIWTLFVLVFEVAQSFLWSILFKEDLDLAENLKLIVDDLQKDDTVLEDYPKNLPVGRPNELILAKYLTVNWGDFELLEITE